MFCGEGLSTIIYDDGCNPQRIGLKMLLHFIMELGSLFTCILLKIGGAYPC